MIRINEIHPAFLVLGWVILVVTLCVLFGPTRHY